MAFTLGNSFAALDDEAALILAAATITTAETQQEQKQQKKKPQSAKKIAKKQQSQAVTPTVTMPPKPLILPEEVLRKNLIFRKPKTINQVQALSNNGKNNISNSDKNKKKPEEENEQRNPAQVVETHNIPGNFMGRACMEAKPALDIEDPIQFPVLGNK